MIVLCIGGSAFAEDPGCPATRARLLWAAQHDASVLGVEIRPATESEPDTVDLRRFVRMTTIVTKPTGCQHVVISDGCRRIRLDVEEGNLCAGPVHIRYRLQGVIGIDARILTLRRLTALYRLGRFPRHLFPRERLAPRWVAALRVHDALSAGANYRDISISLYGYDLAQSRRHSGSDFLRLRVQRLVRVARYMAAGGYEHLLHAAPP